MEGPNPSTAPEARAAATQQAARRRERPPKSAEAKARGLVARKLKRELSNAKDVKAMEKALAQLQAAKGAAPENAPPPAEAQQAQAVPAAQGEPATQEL